MRDGTASGQTFTIHAQNVSKLDTTAGILTHAGTPNRARPAERGEKHEKDYC